MQIAFMVHCFIDLFAVVSMYTCIFKCFFIRTGFLQSSKTKVFLIQVTVFKIKTVVNLLLFINFNSI